MVPRWLMGRCSADGRLWLLLEALEEDDASFGEDGLVFPFAFEDDVLLLCEQGVDVCPSVAEGEPELVLELSPVSLSECGECVGDVALLVGGDIHGVPLPAGSLP